MSAYKQIVLWVKPVRITLGLRSNESKMRKRQEGGDNYMSLHLEDEASKIVDSQEDPGPKTKSKLDASNRRSKYSAEHNKMFELQDIVDDLEKHHSAKYTVEQLRAWGNMIMSMTQEIFYLITLFF